MFEFHFSPKFYLGSRLNIYFISYNQNSSVFKYYVSCRFRGGYTISNPERPFFCTESWAEAIPVKANAANVISVIFFILV